MTRAEILSIKPSGDNLYHIRMSPDRVLKSSYKKPGQFLEIQLGDEKKPFAIASAPGSADIELLVKQDSGIAERLCSMKKGEAVDCSEALGAGFEVNRAVGKNTHLFSMGSGLAPIRSLILWREQRKFLPSFLTLWQGAHTREHLPFYDEYEFWEKSGILIRLCLDRNSDRPEKVTDALLRIRPDLSKSAAYWIGSQGFGEDIGRIALQLGLAPQMLLTNH